MTEDRLTIEDQAMRAQLFERVIKRTEMWLDIVYREIDAASRRKGDMPDAKWKEWMAKLEADRVDTAALLDQLKALKDRTPLLFHTRPRMAKARSEAKAARKKA